MMLEEISYTKRQVPEGVKDTLPREAARRRWLEDKVKKVFQSWGFKEIITPTFEYLDVLLTGWGADSLEKMYKFFDRQGRILALRSDVTTPVARVVATRMKRYSRPLRLSYLANVFRYDEPQVGKQREFSQAGIELLGTCKGEADAEVIAIAIECFKAAGLKDFQISLGQVEFFRGVLDQTNLTELEKKKIILAVDRKDFLTLEQILANTSLTQEEKQLLTAVPQLYGKKEVLEKAQSQVFNQHSQKALDNLREVYQILEDYGLTDYIFIDFGLVRGIDYYTGIVFKVYTPGVGFSLGSGGRYNNLVAEFGEECPAVGFAISMERTLYALEKKEKFDVNTNNDCLLLFPPSLRSHAWSLAGKLRDKGLKIELEVGEKQIELLDEYGREREVNTLLVLQSEEKAVLKFLTTEKVIELDLKEGVEDEISQCCLA